MITKTKSFQTSDGKIFPTVEEAKHHELENLFTEIPMPATADALASIITDYADKIADILTTGPTSKPRARKVNGGKKTKVAPAEGAKV